MTRSRVDTVCVLADWLLTTWQLRSLERVQRSLDVEIPLVVVDGTTIPEAKSDSSDCPLVDAGYTVADFAERAVSRRAWSLVVAERKLGAVLRDEHPLRECRTVLDADCFEGAEIRSVKPITDGVWSELPQETVEAIDSRCDVVVRYGFGLLRGDVLESTEHGVLSFHPGNVRRYRGMGTPKAFVDGSPRAGVTLQRLNEGIDAGEIIAEGEVDTEGCATLWDVQDRQHRLQIALLEEGIRNVGDPSFEPTVPESLGPYYSPTAKLTLGFALSVLGKNIEGRCRKSVPSLKSRIGPGLPR